MSNKNSYSNEKFSFFTVKEEVTTQDKILMVTLFGLLFLAILLYKITGTETVPMLLLACLTGILCWVCMKQLKEPMTKRKAKGTMIIGMMCLAVTLVILFLVVKPFIMS